MKINVELTEVEAILLLCAFDLNSENDCDKCILNHDEEEYYDMGKQLLIKMGVVKEEI